MTDSEINCAMAKLDGGVLGEDYASDIGAVLKVYRRQLEPERRYVASLILQAFGDSLLTHIDLMRVALETPAKKLCEFILRSEGKWSKR